MILRDDGRVLLTDLRAENYSKDEQENLEVKVTPVTADRLELRWRDVAEGEDVMIEVDVSVGSAVAHLTDIESGNQSTDNGTVSSR